MYDIEATVRIVAPVEVITGDRYLGADRWEHYLGFELYRPSSKKIQISMISLAGELVPDVVIAPGRRYAIVKVTNSHRGRWSWTAQEIGPRNRSSHLGLIEQVSFSFIELMKALLVEALPEVDWLYEIKFDGYRTSFQLLQIFKNSGDGALAYCAFFGGQRSAPGRFKI
jgi:hypothetical protein